MATANDTAQREIGAALTEGLLAGFATNSSFTTVKRGIFAFQSSSVATHNVTYEDQWLKAKTGGGQEVVKAGMHRYTRLYAGGVIEQEALEQLGISEYDVTNFLKSILQEQRDKVRLFSSCQPIVRDHWTYIYEVLADSPSISMTVSRETISYKNAEVFVHAFLLCPIK